MKSKRVLSAILLAFSISLVAPPTVHAQDTSNCVDGVICPVPWDAYNCAPLDQLIDCSVCTVIVEGP
jgi:hypothetical protein